MEPTARACPTTSSRPCIKEARKMAWLDITTGQNIADDDPAFAEKQARGDLTFDYYTPYRLSQLQAPPPPSAPPPSAPPPGSSPTGFTINGKPGVFAYRWPDGHISVVSDKGNQ